jgi:outer membrane protein assembly factor BamB
MSMAHQSLLRSPQLFWSASLGLSFLCFGCRVDSFGIEPPPSGDKVTWVAGGSANGQPAANGNTAFFGTTDHQLIAVYLQNGNVRWRARTVAATPNTLYGLNVILAGGGVVFGDYYIYCFDQLTGAKRWVFDPQAQGIEGYAAGAYELSTDGQTIYAGSGSGHVYAINASDGALVWINPLSVDGATSIFNPVIDGGMLYVTVRHFTNPTTGAITALNRSDGNVLWSHVFPSEAPTGSGPIGKVVVHGETVIASNDNGKIYAFDKLTGETKWIAPRRPDVLAYNDSRHLTIAGNVVVAGSDTNYLVGYDAVTGRQLWETDGGQGSSSFTITSNGTTVFVPYINGVLAAFDAKTGTRQWLRSAPDNGRFRPYPLALPAMILAPSNQGLVAIAE